MESYLNVHIENSAKRLRKCNKIVGIMKAGSIITFGVGGDDPLHFGMVAGPL